jgi:AcrR family transcriptional regulator
MEAKKAILTRNRILKSAIELFISSGFEKATMREIAKKAGISPGAIYYYFESKEHVVQAFYDSTQKEHYEACEELLTQERSLKIRLKGIIRKKIELAQPTRDISKVLFRVASDPSNPLSPFSPQSKPVRDEAILFIKEMIEGSEDKIHSDLMEILPEYIWLYQMGIILYWIHDRSENAEKTFTLIHKTSDLIVRLIKLYGSPFMAPVRRKLLSLLLEYRQFGVQDNG